MMYIIINSHTVIPLFNDDGETMYFNTLIQTKLECIKWHLHNGNTYEIIHKHIFNVQFKIG